MRVVLQRVAHAAVEIDGAPHSKIGRGILILLGIEPIDTQEDADWLVKKIAVPLNEYFVEQMKQTTGKSVETGVFGADMQVSLLNDGPVTITMDTHHKE